MACLGLNKGKIEKKIINDQTNDNKNTTLILLVCLRLRFNNNFCQGIVVIRGGGKFKPKELHQNPNQNPTQGCYLSPTLRRMLFCLAEKCGFIPISATLKRLFLRQVFMPSKYHQVVGIQSSVIAPRPIKIYRRS